MNSLNVPGRRLAVLPLTTTITTLYQLTSGAGGQTGQIAVVTGIWVCNRGAESATFDLYSEPAGGASDDVALVHEHSVGAGDFELLPAANASAIFLQPGDGLSARASANNALVMTAYGYTTDPRMGI